MSGFSDPIVAGEVLIRTAIRSDNYVTGVSGWRIARNGTAEFVGLVIVAGGLIELSGATAQTPVLTSFVVGDVNARFILNADGGLGWGPGNAGVDVALYRQAANVLKTDDQFTASRANNNDLALTTQVNGDTFDRFSVTAAGAIDFGPGSGGPDTNLYRNGANILRTDDNYQVGGYLEVQGNLGFYGTASITKPTVTGSRGGNAALASLCTALANLGLITNSTT